MEPLSIGQLAEIAGVHTETVRYYERRGLLAEPPRSAAGYRQYGPDDVWRLLFIARAKGLGFTLTEIAELVDADGDGDADASTARTLAAARRKLAAVDAQLAALTETKARLHELIGVCADGADADCITLNLAR